VSLPAAGWFPDPANATLERWWDGRTWGSATHAADQDHRAAAQTATTATVERQAPRFSISADDVADHGWACGSGVGAVTTSSTGVVQVTAVRRFCTFGWGSLALALVALVIDPYGVVGLAAVLAAVVGMVHPRGTGTWRIAGRSLALTGAVIGVMALAVAAGQMSGAIPA